MNEKSIRELLASLLAGEIDEEAAVRRLKNLPYEDLGFAKVDRHRALRKGFPEVVLGAGKTPEQIEGIVDVLARDGATVLITRTTEEVYKLLKNRHETAEFRASAGMVTINKPVMPTEGPLAAVISAGTSDQGVAEEAHGTLEAMGCRADLVQDIGIAGLHRMLDHLELLRAADVIVVVAGMDGALPSAVAGLVSTPVVAVPTSTGYGASFGGISALLAMLNSCASGVSVVNIDNGFGAGYFAGQVLKKLDAQ